MSTCEDEFVFSSLHRNLTITLSELYNDILFSMTPGLCPYILKQKYVVVYLQAGKGGIPAFTPGLLSVHHYFEFCVFLKGAIAGAKGHLILSCVPGKVVAPAKGSLTF